VEVIANLVSLRKSEMCCTRLAGNRPRGRKMTQISPSVHHRTTFGRYLRN